MRGDPRDLLRCAVDPRNEKDLDPEFPRIALAKPPEPFEHLRKDEAGAGAVQPFERRLVPGAERELDDRGVRRGVAHLGQREEGAVGEQRRGRVAVFAHEAQHLAEAVVQRRFARSRQRDRVGGGPRPQPVVQLGGDRSGRHVGAAFACQPRRPPQLAEDAVERARLEGRQVDAQRPPETAGGNGTEQVLEATRHGRLPISNRAGTRRRRASPRRWRCRRSAG